MPLGIITLKVIQIFCLYWKGSVRHSWLWIEFKTITLEKNHSLWSKAIVSAVMPSQSKRRKRERRPTGEWSCQADWLDSKIWNVLCHKINTQFLPQCWQKLNTTWKSCWSVMIEKCRKTIENNNRNYLSHGTLPYCRNLSRRVH